jgi:hypothetical protein
MKENNLLSRRELLKKSVLASAGVIAAPMINLNRFQLFANSTTEYSAKAIDLVRQSTVLDMLCVLTLDFNKLNKWMADPERLRIRASTSFIRLSGWAEQMRMKQRSSFSLR